MSRNEVVFSLADGEFSEPNAVAPAPAPASGLAEFAESKPVVEPAPIPELDYTDYPKDEWSSRPAAVVVAEPKTARRFSADTPLVLTLLLVLIAAMAAASFYVSFSGLYAAASWGVGDSPALQFSVPVFLDISILAWTLSLFIKRQRGEGVIGTWFAIGTFAAVSSTANILHTLGVSTATTNYELWVGCVISGGAPLLLALATETIAKLVFKPIEKK